MNSVTLLICANLRLCACVVRSESDVFDDNNVFKPDMSHQLFGDRYANIYTCAVRQDDETCNSLEHCLSLPLWIHLSRVCLLGVPCILVTGIKTVCKLCQLSVGLNFKSD